MKKLVLATTAVVSLAGASSAQDLTIGGFVAFEAIYGANYDWDTVEAFVAAANGRAYSNGRSIDDLDFGIDGRLNFDYSNSTKSGLEYGVHLELDVYQSDESLRTQDSDGLLIAEGQTWALPGGWAEYGASKPDRLVGDGVSFNDGYIFINSALGNVKLGDAGAAGAASNQLHVPYLVNALEGDQYQTAELELVKYENSFLGVDFAASVDDDANWNLGLGYSADVGGVNVALGLSAGEETLAGSIGATVGGLAFGVNYAMEEVGSTSEYVATGVSYTMGALSFGTGVETEIRHGDVANMIHNSASGQEYETNYFIGATYEVADGLLLSVGAANLDSDSANNWSASHDLFPITTTGRSGRGFDAADGEQRAWTAGASMKVSF